jgi:hypothetical protein
MTINDRPPEVMEAVFSSFSSFPGNSSYDEMVIVNDRGDRSAIEYALKHANLEARIIDIEGAPGHRPYAVAWNTAFRACRSTHIYAISSDCIQLPNSVAIARWMTARFPKYLVFGKSEHCGRKYTFNFNGCHAKTMTASYIGEPEGFAWLLPAAALAKTTPFGYDEAMTGYCWEHVDLSMRMAEQCEGVLLCDDICAVHIEHDKPYVNDAAVEINREVFVKRHGSDKVSLGTMLKRYEVGPGIGVMWKDGEESHAYMYKTFRNHYNDLS